MNKLFKKTLKGFLIATFVATMLSTIQNASATSYASEDLNTQTVVYSKYNIPYLALTADEVHRATEENLAALALDRANKICENRGYHSALDFDFATEAKERHLALFDDEVVTARRQLHFFRIGTDVAFVTFLGLNSIGFKGVSFFTSILPSSFGRAISIFDSTLIPAALIGTWISYHMSAKRMDNIKLEGKYKRYYAYFTSIDCLEAKGNVSAEQINETKLRYTCNVLQDNDSACNEASVREVSCLVNLSSKDDSPQICKDLAVNIQDDKEFQCTVADIGGYKLPEVCSI